jgi:hypothetical protein
MVGHTLRNAEMKPVILALVAIVPGWAQQTQQAQRLINGVVAGTLQGEDGSQIVGGLLRLQHTSQPRSKRRQTEWASTTGAGGSFRFDRLGEGRYAICVRVPGSQWLDPCEWTGQPVTASLSNARPSATLTIVLKKGAVFTISVDDPARLLPQHEGKTRGANLLLGVLGNRFAFRPARLISRDSRGSNYQAVIPFNVPAKLVVFSSFFRLMDAGGVTLSRAAATHIPITAVAGQQVSTIRLTVTGGGP